MPCKSAQVAFLAALLVTIPGGDLVVYSYAAHNVKNAEKLKKPLKSGSAIVVVRSNELIHNADKRTPSVHNITAEAFNETALM